MRNLNYYMVYAMGENGQSFILTMRNLNREFARKDRLEWNVLY